MKNINISESKRKNINFYVGASTVVGIGRCFQKTARFDDCKDDFERSNDVENLLQLANASIFSDKIFVPEQNALIDPIQKNPIHLGIDKLEECGINNIHCDLVSKGIEDKAAKYGVEAFMVNFNECVEIITAGRNVTTYKGISSKQDILMKDWHQLLCTGKISKVSIKLGHLYAAVVEDSRLLKKLNKVAKEKRFTEEDTTRLCDLMKYHSNLYLASDLNYIFVPGASRLELAKSAARIPNKEKYDIGELTSKAIDNVIDKNKRSKFIPSLHKALLVRSKGSIEGIFNEALKLREKIEDVRKQFPDVWIMDNKYEFEKWVEEISNLLRDELKTTSTSNGHLIFHFAKIVSSIYDSGLKANSSSILNNLNKYHTKRKTKNYLSMLVDLAKDAGLENDTDSLLYYKRLCKACGSD